MVTDKQMAARNMNNIRRQISAAKTLFHRLSNTFTLHELITARLNFPDVQHSSRKLRFCYSQIKIRQENLHHELCAIEEDFQELEKEIQQLNKSNKVTSAILELKDE